MRMLWGLFAINFVLWYGAVIAGMFWDAVPMLAISMVRAYAFGSMAAMAFLGLLHYQRTRRR